MCLVSLINQCLSSLQWIVMTRVCTPAEAARGPRSRAKLYRWSNKWAVKRRCHDDRWTMSQLYLFSQLSLRMHAYNFGRCACSRASTYAICGDTPILCLSFQRDTSIPTLRTMSPVFYYLPFLFISYDYLLLWAMQVRTVYDVTLLQMLANFMRGIRYNDNEYVMIFLQIHMLRLQTVYLYQLCIWKWSVDRFR